MRPSKKPAIINFHNPNVPKEVKKRNPMIEEIN